MEELNGESALKTVLYSGLFAGVMLVTGVLICFPVASLLHRRAWRHRRPLSAHQSLLVGSARAISVLLRLGAAICVLTAVVATIVIDRDYLHLAAMAIMPFAFGEFWRRAEA